MAFHYRRPAFAPLLAMLAAARRGGALFTYCSKEARRRQSIALHHPIGFDEGVVGRSMAISLVERSGNYWIFRIANVSGSLIGRHATVASPALRGQFALTLMPFDKVSLYQIDASVHADIDLTSTGALAANNRTPWLSARCG